MDPDFSPIRRFERFSVELTVVCLSDTPRLPDRAFNLSAGGARIESTTPLPAGTRHRFCFIVPDARQRGAVIDVSGVVAWADHHAMGIKFEGHVGGIDDYVKRLERSTHSI